MAIVALVRHGHSSANADGVLAGWSPGVGLTEHGRHQVSQLAQALAALPVARLVSSPLQRCRESAEILSSHPVEVDDGLGECHYGTWTGAALAELAQDPLWRTIQDTPERAGFVASADFAGETLAAMSARLVATIARLDDDVDSRYGADALWLAVTHGDPLKALLADASGAGLPGLQRFHVDPGSLSLIRRHHRPDGGVRSTILATNVSGAGLTGVIDSLGTATIGRAGDAVVGGGSGGPSRPAD